MIYNPRQAQKETSSKPEVIIRRLAEVGSDLCVLEELADSWRVKRYKRGLVEINWRLLERFGKNKPNPPIDSQLFWQEKMPARLNFSYEDVDARTATSFYDRFVPDLYLRAFPALAWRDFLKDRKGEYSSLGRDEISAGLTENISERIMAAPSLIGAEGRVFPEVAFSNLLSRCFHGAELEDYLREGKEPSRLLDSGMVKPDFVIESKDKLYVVEFKVNLHKDATVQRRKMRRQLTLAAHFMQHNFPEVSVTYVGAEYRRGGKSKEEKLNYWHFKFDQDKRSLVCTLDPNGEV